MCKIISLGKIEKPFLLILGLYLFFELAEYSILFTINVQKNNVILDSQLINNAIFFVEKSFFFIPELIRKKISSINSDQIKYKFTIKNYFQILFVSIGWSIYFFIDIIVSFEATNGSVFYLDFNLLFLLIASILLFKNKYNYHQYISFAILLFISFIRNVILNFNSFISMKILDNYYLFFLLIINSIIFSICIGYSKLFMDKYFLSPHQLIYINGLTGSVIFIILSIISTYFPCNNDAYCLIEYEKKHYFDNIKSFFNHDAWQIIGIFLSLFFNALSELSINILIQKYTLFHYILPIKIMNFVDFLLTDLLLLFSEGIKTLDLIIDFILYIFDIFFILVFLEFIELNFCGLNKNLKRKIIIRAEEDIEETKKISKNLVVDGQYIVDLDDSLIGENEECRESKKEKEAYIEI
jgi:hypothetical protein